MTRTIPWGANHGLVGDNQPVSEFYEVSLRYNHNDEGPVNGRLASKNEKERRTEVGEMLGAAFRGDLTQVQCGSTRNSKRALVAHCPVVCGSAHQTQGERRSTRPQRLLPAASRQ